MLVALYCALALLSMTYVVMTCFNFRKKKTDCPYAPSKSRTPQAAGKSGSDVRVTTSKIKTPVTRRSRWSRTKLSTVKRPSTTTASTVHSAPATVTPQSAEGDSHSSVMSNVKSQDNGNAKFYFTVKQV
ncbi:hypothetical protein Aduo_004853 [Ancylostoma duodenale]